MGAVKYHLEISTDPEFKQLVEEAWLDSANADLMSLRIDALEPGRQSRTMLLGNSSRIARSSLWKGQDPKLARERAFQFFDRTGFVPRCMCGAMAGAAAGPDRLISGMTFFLPRATASPRNHARIEFDTRAILGVSYASGSRTS